MNGKELLDKMSEVDPKLIEDADKKPRKKRALFIGAASGMATVAAALAIAAVISRGPIEKPAVATSSDAVSDVSGTSEPSVSSTPTSDPDTSVPDNGSILTPEPVESGAFDEYSSLSLITSKNYVSGGMGGGNLYTTGLFTRLTNRADIDPELHSPWSVDAELKTMPVYLSKSIDPDLERMRERVKAVAAMLGVAEDELTIREEFGHLLEGSFEDLRKYMEDDGIPEDEIEREINRLRCSMNANGSVGGDASELRIYMYTNDQITVYFNEPYVELPDGCSLKLEATADEYRAAVEYLAEKYKNLLGYEKPTIIRDGVRENDFVVCEGAGDLETQIINYWMNRADFVAAWEAPGDKMHMMRLDSMGNLEKLGDYPIYTPQQALYVLSSDDIPEECRLPANAEVVKADLVYSNYPGYTAVIPYYEFYVKSSRVPADENDTGYDLYRIPAVPEQFIDVEIEDYGARA